MRSFIGDQEIATADELIELALGLGVDAELWLGPIEGENEEERAARLDAGADILADDPELTAPVTALAIAALDTHTILTTRRVPAARRAGLRAEGVTR